MHSTQNSTRINQILATLAFATVSCLATAGASVDLTGTLTWKNNGVSYVITDSSGAVIANAWDFEYQDSANTLNPLVNGSVTKPIGGVPPYAGVLVSHGLGANSNAVTFSASKAPWFAPANYISVAVDYTHANLASSSLCPNKACGGSATNVGRAITALNVLHSKQLIDKLGDIVNRDKTFLYGNSMGAMVTVELAQTELAQTWGDTIKAAAITAGGIFSRNSSNFQLTPSGTAGVANLRIPLIHIHGRKDTTVPTSAAQNLLDALVTNDKVHQMEWNILAGHDVQLKDTTDDFVLAWFDTYRNDAAPRISSLSRRAISTGYQMYVRGTGFGGNPYGYSQLKFNSTLSTSSSWANELITVDVPVTEPSGYVTVTVPVGPVNAVETVDPAVGSVRIYENPIGGARSNRSSY